MKSELHRLEKIEAGLMRSLDLVREQIQAEHDRQRLDAERLATMHQKQRVLRRAEAKLARAEERLKAEQACVREQERHLRLVAKREREETKSEAARRLQAERKAKEEEQAAFAMDLAHRAAVLVAEAATNVIGQDVSFDSLLEKKVKGPAKPARSALISLLIDRVGLTNAEVSRALNITASNVYNRYHYGLGTTPMRIYEVALGMIDAGALNDRSEEAAE